MERHQRRASWNIVLTACLALVVAIHIFPIYVMVSTALKTEAEYYSSQLRPPSVPQLINVKVAWQRMAFDKAMLNSALIVVFSVGINVLISSMAAYPLSRHPTRWHKILFVIFIAGIMLPFQSGMVPLFVMMRGIKLLGTYGGVILVFVALITPITVFIYSGFLSTVPKELDESAYVDGYSRLQIFWKVLFPLMKPATATCVIITTMFVWNDFITPMVLIDDPLKKPIPPSVFVFFGQYWTKWNYCFAGLVLAMIPLTSPFPCDAKAIHQRRHLGSGQRIGDGSCMTI